MSKCVIILQEKHAAKELMLKLREAQTPILSCDLIQPLNKETDKMKSNLVPSQEEFTNQVNFNDVKLLNPILARKDRQKTLATWLVPFGFITGLSFSAMTGLNTFSELGFPNQLEKLLGGLVGMISGWLGSFFSAGGINQDLNDDLRSLRKKSEQGLWLLILETPIEVELPWMILQDIKVIELITLDKE